MQKNTVIIGGTGQLGRALLKLVPNAAAPSSDDLDIRWPQSIDSYMSVLQRAGRTPEWIINTAAMHDVVACEKDPTGSFDVNAIGAHYLARTAALYGARVLHVSTDYVFGGAGSHGCFPYSEISRPAPVNVYGASKLAGENLVLQVDPRNVVVRTAGLFGGVSKKGHTFPDLMVSLAKSKGRLQVVEDQFLSPSYAPDVAARIVEIMEAGGQGVFHGVNSSFCSWARLAEETLDLVGIDVPLKRVTTNQPPPGRFTPRRPSFSALEDNRGKSIGLAPMRPWDAALREYVKEKML